MGGDRAGDFDLGEFLGIGLDNRQVAYLAGALFLGLFGLSALRHAKRAGGLVMAVWLVVAAGLFAGTLLVAARGFPEYTPDWLAPWADPDRLARAGAVVALLGIAAVLLSAHWVRGSLARFAHRVAGLGLIGLAVWLAAGWFAADVPDEVRPWTARAVLVRVGVVIALGCLAAAFWFRQTWGSAQARWANRALTPPAAAMAVILAWRWFGELLGPELAGLPVERVTAVLAAVATGTCLLIAGGSYLLRDRPAAKTARPEAATPAPAPRPVSNRPLPVAILIDEHGQPVLPPVVPRSGPAGA